MDVFNQKLFDIIDSVLQKHIHEAFRYYSYTTGDPQTIVAILNNREISRLLNMYLDEKNDDLKILLANANKKSEDVIELLNKCLDPQVALFYKLVLQEPSNGTYVKSVDYTELRSLLRTCLNLKTDKDKPVITQPVIIFVLAIALFLLYNGYYKS